MAQHNLADLEERFCRDSQGNPSPHGVSYPQDYFQPLYYDSIRHTISVLRRSDGKRDPEWIHGVAEIAQIINDPLISADDTATTFVYEVVAEGFRRFYYILNRAEITIPQLNKQLHPNSGAYGSKIFIRYMDSSTPIGAEIGDRIRDTIGLSPDAMIGDVSLMIDTARELMYDEDYKIRIEGMKRLVEIYRMFGMAKLISDRFKRLAPSDKDIPAIPSSSQQSGSRPRLLQLGGINNPQLQEAMRKNVVLEKSGGRVKPITAEFEEVKAGEG